MYPPTLTQTDDFPIRCQAPVYSGKVRAVYWLDSADARRLCQCYPERVAPDAPLGVMIISDRISAFDCIWRGEDGLDGVPGKGAALNAISLHWFEQIATAGLADHHVVDAFHPLAWLVQRTRPLRFEMISRQYITGSLWRAYTQGVRHFCGIDLPEGLQQHQKLDSLWITPSTKGTLRGLEGIEETEDAPISQADILRHYKAFGLPDPTALTQVYALLRDGFALAAKGYARCGQILVDTKFEFGYVDDAQGQPQLIFMDEVATPDSSRLWDQDAYKEGRIVERCKETFRQALLARYPKEVLTDPAQMPARIAIARAARIPADVMMEISQTYRTLAEAVTGTPLPMLTNPREELLDALSALKLLR